MRSVLFMKLCTLARAAAWQGSVLGVENSELTAKRQVWRADRIRVPLQAYQIAPPGTAQSNTTEWTGNDDRMWVI
jgi:hypothetical protein